MTGEHPEAMATGSTHRAPDVVGNPGDAPPARSGGQWRGRTKPAFRSNVDNRHTSTLPYSGPGPGPEALPAGCQLSDRRRSALLVAVAGTLSSAVLVGCWARLSVRADPGATDPSRWAGLLPAQAATNGTKAVLLVAVLLALTVLAASYWRIQGLIADGLVRRRFAALVAAAWALPFVLGPPVGSRDAYAYAAQGELARQGLDPVRIPVRVLGPGPLLAAVDPRWRDSVPPYGGLGVLTERLAATFGHLTGGGATGSAVASIIALKILSAGAVAGLAVLAGLIGARLGTNGTRAAFLAGANPLVLLHLVGGAHLDALAVLLVLAAVAAYLVGIRESRWLWIGVLVGLAVAVKVTMLVLLLWLVLQAGRVLRRAILMVVGAVASFAAVTAASGSGMGWVHALGTPGQVRTGAALSDQLSQLAGGGLAGFRLAVEGIGVLIALAFLIRTRPSVGRTQRSAVWGLAVAFLVVGVSGPVFYPWYLAPGLILLGCCGGRSVRAVGLLSVLAMLTSLPTMAPLSDVFPGAGPLLLVGCLLALFATVTVARTATTTSSTLRDSSSSAAPMRPETRSL
jgi:alpha-1,6-mannosyltransferase